MCGATCPLVEDFIAGRLDPSSTVLDGGKATRAACPSMHGIIVVDADGIVHFCNEGAAQAMGATAETVTGMSIATLIPELKFRRGTPGYNIAYALFWFPDQQWRRVYGVAPDGEVVLLELSISAARVNGRHQLLVAVCRAHGAATSLAHPAADGECSAHGASRLALLSVGQRRRSRAGAALPAESVRMMETEARSV